MQRHERAEKAKELVECLGLWGISVNDALSIAHSMKLRLEGMDRNKPITIEGANVLSNEARQRILHEPIGDC